MVRSRGKLATAPNGDKTYQSAATCIRSAVRCRALRVRDAVPSGPLSHRRPNKRAALQAQLQSPAYAWRVSLRCSQPRRQTSRSQRRTLVP